jgi:hypothetical protein
MYILNKKTAMLQKAALRQYNLHYFRLELHIQVYTQTDGFAVLSERVAECFEIKRCVFRIQQVFAPKS